MGKSFAIWLAFAVLSSGCSTVDQFALPPGNEADGREAFVSLGCVDCHSAEDTKHNPSADSGMHYRLGGLKGEKSYVELVTSIINPSHRIVERAVPTADVVEGKPVSKMPVFNDVMTVRQLSDIVRYLAPQYGMAVVPYYEYPGYEYY